jgi:hypothetical protein
MSPKVILKDHITFTDNSVSGGMLPSMNPAMLPFVFLRNIRGDHLNVIKNDISKVQIYEALQKISGKNDENFHILPRMQCHHHPMDRLYLND